MKKQDMEFLKNELVCFLGSRMLTEDLKNYLKNKESLLKGNFYRGMPFPQHLLKVGAIIEEWHGSSHWSIDKSIALGFSEDYLNEDYHDELSAKLGIEEVPFVPMVMKINNLNGIEVYKILEELNVEDFQREKEITTIGKDFIIENFHIEKVDEKDVCIANVSQI